MRHSIKSLIGFTLGATDGELGKVKDFYVDDETWTVRYLIVDTGNWLSGRVVLISPESVLGSDRKNKIFSVNLTKEQVKNSPDINTDLPVSRQEEIKLHAYYPWIAYWNSGYYGSGGGAIALPSDPLAIGMPYSEFTEKLAQKEMDADKHLRSTNKVTGYTIKAADGEIGEVEDFIIDETKWAIDLLLIDTGKWLPGKKVLISPKLIKEIDWETSTVMVETSVAFVKSSPEYDPAQLIQVVDPKDLHEHFSELASHSQ
ncbi:MAG: PRC-barrel domain-containing protein [Cyclobacteriaceae bacterium]|nr:PRC-barrel domain-containing protein [Cyclobacteriaceae bacterium]